MTSHQRLYKDMIRDSRLWNLYLATGTDSIDVMAYCPLEDHSLFTATIPLDPNTQRVTAIEEAVYDNPLLLNDFNRITIVCRGNNRAIVPTELTADKTLTRDIVSEITGCSTGTMIVDQLPLLDASICHIVDTVAHNFLLRTFGPDTRFIHRLSALTRYCHGTHRGTGSLTSHVNLRRSSMDIILYDGDRLLLANTYPWTEAADALYYIVATRNAFGIDNNNPVVLSGDRDVRTELTPLLREYIPTVMPAVFPAAMFRTGGQTAMNTPTDLIVLPLCE